jgi:glycosyltransferase involved in cell wall biosynthesis
MKPISVVIITLNEEHNIGRCLESVKEVADEIVVVDSLSSDRTNVFLME